MNHTRLGRDKCGNMSVRASPDNKDPTGDDGDWPSSHLSHVLKVGAAQAAPRRLLRPTQPVSGYMDVKGYMFTQQELSEREASNYGSMTPEFVKLRYKFRNRNLWDTLTGDVVNMMLNPPKEYDPDYHKQVNIAILTSMKAIE